jgi:PadR family transcriptional regulator PadR
MKKEQKQSAIGLELPVLQAAMTLGKDADGGSIRKAVDAALLRSISPGAIYTVLDRLETKGWITSAMGEPTVKRQGNRRKYFEVTGSGVDALLHARRTMQALGWLGVGEAAP